MKTFNLSFFLIFFFTFNVAVLASSENPQRGPASFKLDSPIMDAGGWEKSCSNERDQGLWDLSSLFKENFNENNYCSVLLERADHADFKF